MATLPRLSQDGRQIKTYAPHTKSPFGKVEKESIAISKKAYGYLFTKDVCLVLDVENNHICFVTKESDLSRGFEPPAKKFTSSKMGLPFKGLVDQNHLKGGFLTLKPYTILFSLDASKILGENALEWKLGLKRKRNKDGGNENEVSIERTLSSKHRIWVLCRKNIDRFETVEEAFPDAFAALPREKQNDFRNYIVVDTKDENQLMKFDEVDFFKMSVEMAKQAGAEEPKE